MRGGKEEMKEMLEMMVIGVPWMGGTDLQSDWPSLIWAIGEMSQLPVRRSEIIWRWERVKQNLVETIPEGSPFRNRFDH